MVDPFSDPTYSTNYSQPGDFEPFVLLEKEPNPGDAQISYEAVTQKREIDTNWMVRQMGQNARQSLTGKSGPAQSIPLRLTEPIDHVVHRPNPQVVSVQYIESTPPPDCITKAYSKLPSLPSIRGSSKDQLKSEVEAQREQIERLKREKQEAEFQRQSADQDVRRLRDQVDTARREKREVLGYEQTAKGEAARQAARVKTLERQAEDLRQQAEDADRRCRSVQEDLEDAQRRQRFPVAAATTARAAVGETSQLHRLRVDLEAADAKTQALMKENAALAAEVDRLTRQAQGYQAQVVEARREKESALGEVGVLRERATMLKRELGLVSASGAESLAAERRAWEEERQGLRTEVVTLEERLGWRRQEADDLRRQLDTARAGWEDRERELQAEAVKDAEAARGRAEAERRRDAEQREQRHELEMAEVTRQLETVLAALRPDQARMEAAAGQLAGAYAATSHVLHAAFAAHRARARRYHATTEDGERVDIDEMD